MVSSREFERLGVDVEVRLLSLVPLAVNDICCVVVLVVGIELVTDFDAVSSSDWDTELLRDTVCDCEVVTDLLSLRSFEELREMEYVNVPD